MTVRVTVKLYASLSKYLPDVYRKSHAMPMDVSDETTIETILEPFGMPPGSIKLVVVNGVFIPPSARATTRFIEGDVLAIWPPVAGG